MEASMRPLTKRTLRIIPVIAVFSAAFGVLAESSEASPQTQNSPNRIMDSSVLTARCCMAFAYFPTPVNKVIMYGGQDTAGVFAETWSYDLTGGGAGVWTQVCQNCAPGPRGSTRMVYDSVRGKIVLFGGKSMLDDTAVPTGTRG
jgi:hypothetical protein